uniref:EF-hand domain-containing protein n=1 Tax=Haptolina brevifila TaxID=156173 RepID=A0A7S2FP13_9EUKA|mmetsp:Transcript_16702/g.33671  ORF Transcript_16702/g.33671 Transcript_16702/m.33671 type:complete len:458 (+) Transcript_16702:42-1415(+)
MCGNDPNPTGATKNEVYQAAVAYMGSDEADTNVTWPWLGSGPGSSLPDTCKDCMIQNLTFTWKVPTSLKFASYPFDEQQFTLIFGFGADSNVFSCNELMTASGSLLANLAAKSQLSSILPASDEYILRQDGMSVRHPLISAGGVMVEDTSKCELTVYVKRYYFTVFLKILIPTIIIVYLGLSAAFLSAQEHSGDRAALLGVSILICMVNLDRDHGLGKLMYSTWFDTFNLCQLGLQVLGLLEGYVEHHLARSGREPACIVLNRVWCGSMMLGIYPVVTIALCLIGTAYITTAIILLTVLLPLIIIYATYVFVHRLSAGASLRAKLALQLTNVATTAPEFPGLLKAAFTAYDVDSSGQLDMSELRSLLKAIYSKSQERYLRAMELARAHATASNGELSMVELADVIDQLESTTAAIVVTRPLRGMRERFPVTSLLRSRRVRKVDSEPNMHHHQSRIES